ncbi:hypothetical protein PSDVSF_09670 [Pseudodesulfovibrio sediminis]|uniref:Uncharacterized protein n=1 Tax=Pseudodesulfovibrio sediminis TaxID=2810563 RepID=A0ABM9SDP6_9BACT|nr:hypothetical protein PSDVSF_09670 [Pseudodesulfovibrio sediminis]
MNEIVIEERMTTAIKLNVTCRTRDRFLLDLPENTIIKKTFIQCFQFTEHLYNRPSTYRINNTIIPDNLQ